MTQVSMLGQLLDGRYQICDRLAQGGFSETYIAKDTKRPGHPRCVVKHLNPYIQNSWNDLETAQRLFKQEAEILEKLGYHDQIPQLLAHCEVDGGFYLVQEWIDGQSLDELLQPQQRWTEAQVVHLLQEILGILDFVHRQGIIHRDIKPGNIICRRSDRHFVLIDFGTVKPFDPKSDDAPFLTRQTIAVSSEGYTPIEQLRGKPCPASDLYALGMIAIQALTGLHPKEFEESLYLQEITWSQHTEASPGLIAGLTTMTRYHWKDRYSSAQEVLQDLQNWFNGSDVVRTSTSPISTTPIQSTIYTPTLIKPSASIEQPSLINQELFTIPDKPQFFTQDSQPETVAKNTPDVEAQVAQPKVNLHQTLRIIQRSFTPRVVSFLLGLGLISGGMGLFLWLIAGWGNDGTRSQPSLSAPPPIESLISTLPGEVPIYLLAFSPNGTALVSSGTNNAVVSWDLQMKQPIQLFSDHFDTVTAVAISPDGQFLATGGRDARVSLWDLRSGKLLHCLKEQQWDILSIAFSADSQMLVVSSADHKLNLWNIQTGKLLHTFSEFATAFPSIAVSSSNLLIAGSEDNTIKVWDLHTRQLLHTLKGHRDEVLSVAISPNGAVLASGSADHTIKLWNIYTGELLHTLSGHFDTVRSVAISSDGRTVVSGSSDHTVKVWDLYTGTLLKTLYGHASDVYSVAINPDQRIIASGGLDRTIQLWQMP
jgi:WD40 repeat protein/tRNA A-37 threonylcarbamoyl transferase component Bud32